MTRAARYLLALIGVLLVGVGAIGVVVPGLPTTIFLLLASWCFARSCPWLEERLLKRPLFRPYLAYLDGSRPVTPRARAGALAMMWLAIGVSAWTFGTAEAALALCAAGAVGTIAILRFGRRRAA